MNYQPETDTYPDGINEIETTTQALGGVGGPINAPFLQQRLLRRHLLVRLWRHLRLY